jgi:hypothetical protein
MAVTLKAVAVTDKRIMNREKDFCRLNAMRCAMNKDSFIEICNYQIYKQVINATKAIAEILLIENLYV